MWLGSDYQEPAPASTTAVMVISLIGMVIFVLGYRIAVNRRANADYKALKAAKPKAQKAFWMTWLAAVRFAFWTVLAVALLMSWAVHDAKELAGR